MSKAICLSHVICNFILSLTLSSSLLSCWIGFLSPYLFPQSLPSPTCGLASVDRCILTVIRKIWSIEITEILRLIPVFWVLWFSQLTVVNYLVTHFASDGLHFGTNIKKSILSHVTILQIIFLYVSAFLTAYEWSTVTFCKCCRFSFSPGQKVSLKDQASAPSYSIEVKSMTSNVRLSQFKFKCPHLIAMWAQKSSILSPSFLICKMG